ncbi:cyclic nucleotide-binding domain-containing protein [Pseudochrobactrum algeriensis]|uniref:CRP-like cAMP-binding protein n=1 Tax=Pseudochrobactrum saccharolyticum TaxID=354352 RepID=A0A7W8EPN7_9HYPH|nr:MULTISPECIES: cyclic nucleotide-binding domain-containing protein [Pseudochrobactrum]MBX8784460.1 cyclic nucleotide-binding domain-containing protein [Ochrobactrum sp. GRS2]KAB0540923.1 cyclic nucleotide-binding domain-containing protein [Pseudochrobactrum saccharolyticum]MBB5090527.1 CRP-like cAMP-binding protein [Pseudochrobactrum saccharolyticum]MDP8252428.1 cyclic nucleotide-binding domain-containing protein [Pseudochrobactrum saccharolyticum]QVQ36713.1 cyclic nucleotide-binding domain-
MALDDDIQFLSTIGLFEAFSAQHLRLLAFGAERMVLRTGRELFHEGQSADCAYIVVSGSITLFHEGKQGRVNLRSISTGSVLGEMALIAQTSRLTGAVADTETEVIRLSRSIFHRILEEYPELAASLYLHISNNLNEMVEQIDKLSSRFSD